MASDVLETQIILITSNAITALNDLSIQVQQLRAQIDGLNGTSIDLSGMEAQFARVDDYLGNNVAGYTSLDNAINGVAPKTEEMAESSVGSINIINTALGALTAMLTFQVVNAIITTFTNAIKYAQDYYQSLVQINVAQSAMAQAGISTTQQDLLGIAQDLEKTWSIISKTDMTEAVAQTAILGTQYKLNDDQIKTMVNDEALLFASGKVKDMTTAENDMIAVLKGDTSTAKWAADAGISFDKVAFDAEAAKLEIVQIGGAWTDAQRVAIDLGLVTDGLAKSTQSAIDNQKSAADAGLNLSSQWKTTLTEMGQLFEPVLLGLQDIAMWVVQHIIPAIQGWESYFIGLVAAIAAGATVIDTALIDHANIIDALKQHWADANKEIADYLINLTKVAGVNTTTNTPVNLGGSGAGSTSPSVAVDTTKVEDTLDTVAKDYEDYYNTVEKDTQDYNNKIDDINSKENEDLLNESQDYRVKELQQEQDFEDKMENLQAEFELKLQGDLEDRDARKVLEDTAKYNLDVQTDNNENQIRMQQDQQNENLKMQQIKENADLERQQEQRDYQQQLQDAQTSLDQKLQDEAVALQKDKGLQKTSAEDIYEILKQYYGPGGYIEQLQEYSYLSSVAMNSRLLASLQQLAHSVSTGEGIQSTQTGSGRKYAAGGIELATSATNATFGEAGPELAMFLPLNQSSIAPTFTTGLASAASQNGGTFNIIVQMDDGLVANIVEDSMNATAEVIQRSNRSS